MFSELNVQLKRLKESNIWFICECVIVTFAVCLTFQMTTSNFLYLLVGGLYAVVGKRRILLEKRETQVNIILSCGYALCMIMGRFEYILASELPLPWPIRTLICYYGFYLCFTILIENILVYFRSVRIRTNANCAERKKISLCFWITFVSLVLMWGIGLAISYPGNTTADSNGIIYTALGNAQMKAAVPVIYVLAIRYLWDFGFALFGTPNASLAVCASAHIIIISLIVAFMISELYRCNVKKWICVIVWLFYAVVPYNVQFSHIIWKDVPFSAFTFLLMILIWEQFNDNVCKTKAVEYGRLLLIIIAAVGMCLMRSNGMFAYLFFLPFGLWSFWGKNKKVFFSLILALFIVRVIQGPVYDKIMTEHAVALNNKMMEEQSSEIEEKKVPTEVKNATDAYNSTGIFIITIQQFARVAVDRQDLSAEEYVRLNKIFDVEKVREVYNPHLMDPVGKLRNYKLSTGDYLKEWLYFGTKYPIEFFMGWRDQTLGYWYPDVQHWVYTDQIKDNDIGLYKDSILTDDARYEWLQAEELYKDIPIYGMLWSIGFVVWTTFLFMGVTYIKKGIKALLPYLLVIGVWATLIVATPVYAEFRYIYPMFLCLPLTILMPFVGEWFETK